MTPEMEKEYTEQKYHGDSKNAFYIDEKKASNFIGADYPNLKVRWCLKKIKDNPKQKFIIYAGLYQLGIQLLEKAWHKLKLPC